MHIIRTSGAEERVDCSFDGIRKLIAADCFDTVNLRDGRVMLVDDNGYESEAVPTAYGVKLNPVRARKPVNRKATALYHAVCHPGTTHEIVGDVAIVVDAELE